MTDQLEEYRQQASYRRGTVMGLTAAEAFMLIAFILLTLLVLWRVTANEEKAQLIEENTKLIATLEGVEDPAALATALAIQRRFAEHDEAAVEESLSLMEDDKLKTLAMEASTLPNDGLLELTDLTRDGAFPGAREKLELFDKVSLGPAEIAGLVEQLNAAKEEQLRLKEELAAYSATGLSPEQITGMEETLDELDIRHASLAQTGAQIAATIEEKAGDKIAALGGKILPDGDVIFPDAILFDAGQDRIKPDFDRLLQSFCRLWFETLYQQREALDTVQVEGHASSEYASLGAEQAFVRNLDLSQRRAAAVFGRCLALGGNDEVTDWARTAMAAVGYSSSRAIMENGIENRSASRRVVFALEPKTESQMTKAVLAASSSSVTPTAFTSDSTELPGPDRGNAMPDEAITAYLPDYYSQKGYSQISGAVTHVRDGDTLEIGEIAIRIEGLHAPEINTTMGREARSFLTDLVSGEIVSCWLSGTVSFDRNIGVCFVDGQDVAAVLVAEGLGRDCPAFSDGRYARFENDAMNRVRGLPSYCLRD
ncbi:MAG: hypothetical protein HWE30_19160 [Methylocystaceae bacterium]|nr:hypothetical protein [Methylocystaceae bacterium]